MDTSAPHASNLWLSIQIWYPDTLFVELGQGFLEDFLSWSNSTFANYFIFHFISFAQHNVSTTFNHVLCEPNQSWRGYVTEGDTRLLGMWTGWPREAEQFGLFTCQSVIHMTRIQRGNAQCKPGSRSPEPGNAQNTLRLKPQTQNNPSHNPPHNPSQPRETKMLRLSILNHTSCTVRGDILAECW